MHLPQQGDWIQYHGDHQFWLPSHAKQAARVLVQGAAYEVLEASVLGKWVWCVFWNGYETVWDLESYCQSRLPR